MYAKHTLYLPSLLNFCHDNPTTIFWDIARGYRLLYLPYLYMYGNRDKILSWKGLIISVRQSCGNCLHHVQYPCNLQNGVHEGSRSLLIVHSAQLVPYQTSCSLLPRIPNRNASLIGRFNVTSKGFFTETAGKDRYDQFKGSVRESQTKCKLGFSD